MQQRRRPRKKNVNTIVIVLVLILLGLFILRRTNNPAGSVHNRHRCHGTKLLGGNIRRVRPKFTHDPKHAAAHQVTCIEGRKFPPCGS